MRRRLPKAAFAALLALLAVLVPLTLPTPALAEDLPVELDLVSGQLNIRDGEEPADLAAPTTFDATIDNETGQITGGNFSAAPLSFEFDITDPIPARIYVDAIFTQLTPGAATGQVTEITHTEDGEPETAEVAMNVDVRVDLHIEVGKPSFLESDCVATPVSLRLTSSALYDYGTDQVTLEDADFSVPEVPTTTDCLGIIADGVNERLAGGATRSR